ILEFPCSTNLVVTVAEGITTFGNILKSRCVAVSKYIMDIQLEKLTKEVSVSAPNNIEYIARSLTIKDLDKITNSELIAYGRFCTALSKAECRRIEEGQIENKEEIKKRSNKMEEIMKTEEEEDMQIGELRKRRQEEEPEKKIESKERNIKESIQQTKSEREGDEPEESIVISGPDASSYDWLKEKEIE
ncbi:9375_t:CDS:2, partial [Ambispora leptoticha]